jgi:hypothetical protein
VLRSGPHQSDYFGREVVSEPASFSSSDLDRLRGFVPLQVVRHIGSNSTLGDRALRRR